MSDLRRAAEKIAPELVAVRRQIHSWPEPAFQEERTAQLVCDYVRGLGLQIFTGVGGTGVVAVHEGDPEAGTIALRADMDCILVQEDTGLPYASQRPGFMHACGHDAHVAMLLGAAKLIATHRELFPGRVVFLFQPAEELPPGGAVAMIADGALSDHGVEAVAALHVSPDLPAGQFGLRPGPIMAAADRFTLTITGQGGHGAAPQNTVDAIAVAAQVVTALQQIVSRQADPQEPLVLTIGAITGGTGFNVITDRVQMTGTTRYLNPAFRAWLPERMAAIAQGVAAAFGGGARLDYEPAFSPVINDHRLVELAARVVAGMEGSFVWLDRPVMVGEDFARYLEKVPGVYSLLGIRPKAGGHPWHHPGFVIDESALPLGCAYLAGLAREYGWSRRAELGSGG